MDRRRPLAVIAALSAVVALHGAPVAADVVSVPRIAVTDLPVLSELPPLPAEGEVSEPEQQSEPKDDGMSAVQIIALVLAVGVLVAGGTGLALVTRRARGEVAEEPSQPGSTPPRHAP